MRDRLPRAGFLLSLGLLSASVGFYGQPFAVWLMWAGGLLCTSATVGGWLVEDLDGVQPERPRLRRILRLSSPAFWVFPLLVMHHNQPEWTPGLVLGVVGVHAAALFLSRVSTP